MYVQMKGEILNVQGMKPGNKAVASGKRGKKKLRLERLQQWIFFVPPKPKIRCSDMQRWKKEDRNFTVRGVNRLFLLRKRRWRQRVRTIFPFLIKPNLPPWCVESLDDVATGFTGNNGHNSLLCTSPFSNGIKYWQKYRHTVMMYTHKYSERANVCLKCRWLTLRQWK